MGQAVLHPRGQLRSLVACTWDTLVIVVVVVVVVVVVFSEAVDNANGFLRNSGARHISSALQAPYFFAIRAAPVLAYLGPVN